MPYAEQINCLSGTRAKLLADWSDFQPVDKIQNMHKARSAEIPELRTEPLMRSCSSSTASMKVKNVKKLCFTKGHFPKLAECAHFHYENVDFGTIQSCVCVSMRVCWLVSPAQSSMTVSPIVVFR
eukprot:superscaffoldBa00000032_g611